ncbi:trypsin-like serine peptidase [Novosphingobium album (ex Hu et al. 2023)]|uniref:Serine protease n=1 Tax=Novosphingobium album (ex Hu et al. 2023) TaxID=2930093 RepID=A0ABT0B8E4_9SPHN|nr:serine protease [Novosphingobium album (ex Hu et al. 2023)]MCJ2181064.1 serine protease [Novosphingobium album (ex Hu et al. 2023)]
MDVNNARLCAAVRMVERGPARRARGAALAEFMGGADVDPTLIEPIDRQQARAKLLHMESLGTQIGKTPEASRKLFEAVIGKDDSLPRRFLASGDAAARAVGRVIVHGGALYGTGSLIGSRVMITNNHVLPDTDTADGSAIELGYYEPVPGQAAFEGQSFPLDPDLFFYTSEDLDFTLCGVQSEIDGRSTANFGALDLFWESGKALVGERVNIVHHAGGRPQVLSIRENAMVDIFDDWLHYLADTEPGSSGAAVFNDEWQMIALHHASVPTGDGSVMNEGVRVSSIVAHLVGAMG